MLSDVFKGLGSFWMLAMLALILLPSRYLVYMQDGRKTKGKNVKGTYSSESWLHMRKKKYFPGELCLISLAHGQPHQQERQKKYCFLGILVFLN